MEPFLIVLAIIVVLLVVGNLFRSRREKMKAAENQSNAAYGSGLSTAKDLFADEMAGTAPVDSFHVVGEEAIVTFSVPLGDDDDEVLNDLLVAQAVEVVRDKRKHLPIDGVTEIVVNAGDPAREVGRAPLPEPGQLPPPPADGTFGFQHVAHDPFAAPFDQETDHSVSYDTAARAPSDDLGSLKDELKIPKGLERGLRAAGSDPDAIDGPDFVISLLRIFGYSLTEHSTPGSYIAMKGGNTTYIYTHAHEEGGHPELDEGVIRRFIGEFASSGADRGMLVSDKYGPFAVYDIERNQPKVRFVTRERLQQFIDSMAVG